MKAYNIAYQYASINSYDKMNANTDCECILIGTNYNLDEYRGLIKFDLNQLPDNIQIIKATLSLCVTRGSNFQLFGYNLKSDWNICNINWLNQPSIEYNNHIFDELIYGCGKYDIDLTNQVEYWLECPCDNYGMVLMGMNASSFNNIEICTNQMSRYNLSLEIEYCILNSVNIVPKFFESKEVVHVSAGCEYFTTGKNISLINRVSYFIKNYNYSTITVIAENSPDNVNYAKEIQAIFIPPGGSSLLVPINFSKYVRLSITVAPNGNTSPIDVWLNLQQ